MKNRLIAALMVVTSLCTWTALAVNPHVLEAKLDIDGVADSAEFDPGPGGFVAKDGWKKITLGYDGVPLRMRLNWESEKIAVYLTTNSPAPIDNPTFWDVENGEIMPTNLWVKGLEVSDNGPTDSTCGPEHICLEAINNGTSYVTPFYDRVGLTVVTVTNIEYCRMDNFDSEDADWVTKLNVAAGAKDTDVHKAKVRITIAPAVAGVSLVATNSGGLGDAIPCFFSPATTLTSDSDGYVFGDYTSSDKTEDATIKVISLADWPVSIDLGSTLSNRWDCAGEYDWIVPEIYITDVEDEVRYYPTLDESGGLGCIDTHDIHHYVPWVHLMVYEFNFNTGLITPREVEGEYPDYWENDETLPDWLRATTVDQVVEITDEAEDDPGVYKSNHTVRNILHDDITANIMTLVITDEYKLGAYDMDVYYVP